MVLTSSVGHARPNSSSLRATVPEGIVSFLDLKHGDQITWEMQTQNDKRIVIVKKKEIKE